MRAKLMPKVVERLPHEPTWHGRRIGYGRVSCPPHAYPIALRGQDRCAYVPKAQQSAVQAAQAQAQAAMVAQQVNYGGGYSPYSPVNGAFSPYPNGTGFASPMFSPSNGERPLSEHVTQHQAGNRNVYIGNIATKASLEDLCDVIRGGAIERIKYLQEKNIAVSD